MTRRAPCVTAAAVAVIALFASVPAGADETEPVTSPTSTPATGSTETTTPASPSDPGSIDEGGEVTSPNPDALPAHGPRVLVFGDSISAIARYSMAGTNRPKVWWSFLADRIGVPARQIMVSAEGGSGLLARGAGVHRKVCSGSTFGERIGEIAATKPDVVIVAGGRNDMNTCVRGLRVRSTAAERRHAATTYFNALARAVDRQGIHRSNVYVVTPWGSFQSTGSVSVTTLYEQEANARGFTWIPTPALVHSYTMDGTHPNAQGAQLFAATVTRASDITQAVRSHGTLHPAVPVRHQVLCSGLGRCQAQGFRNHQYGAAKKRIWGLPASTAGHYVAHRLTRGKVRTAPILTATTARAWRTATTRESAARQMAHAKVGDVAWWQTAPAGTGAASRGHVAVVERVAKDNSWVVVSEVTSRGVFRSVRYAGATLPRAYLRFKRANGNPRGSVTGLATKRGGVTVRGIAVDPDRPQLGVRIRVKVTQGGRTWVRTTSRPTQARFKRNFSLPGLRAGRATVRVIAVNTSKTPGKNRTFHVRRVTVR